MLPARAFFFFSENQFTSMSLGLSEDMGTWREILQLFLKQSIILNVFLSMTIIRIVCVSVCIYIYTYKDSIV